ncbi:IS6 family transposase, partial [Mesorhizobium sp. M0933]
MFKGRHFDQSVILLCVPWYLTYKLVHFWLQLLE